MILHSAIQKLILLTILVFSPDWLRAQSAFPNTLAHDSLAGSPPATLEALKWLAGSWKGKAFGGVIEEVWTAPKGGSIMCAFKLIVRDKVSFYELISITEENGALVKRLRHFHPDLRGWEEKDEPMTFNLIKVTDNKIYFDGFTYERVSNDEINIYAVLQQRDGSRQEMKFNYHRE